MADDPAFWQTAVLALLGSGGAGVGLFKWLDARDKRREAKESAEKLEKQKLEMAARQELKDAHEKSFSIMQEQVDDLKEVNKGTILALQGITKTNEEIRDSLIAHGEDFRSFVKNSDDRKCRYPKRTTTRKTNA